MTLPSGNIAPPPPPTQARMLALLVPFAYFFHSRVPTSARKLGWVLNYLVPVLALAAAAHGGWPGLLPAAIMLVAVYAAYEFGYLVNDTLTVEHEAEPTLRLDEATRQWMRARLGLAFAVRAGVGLTCLGIWVRFTPSPQPLIVIAGWLALWPCFALYNRWRGHITIGLHFVLVSLRFLLPILAAVQPGSVIPHWALLLCAYPLVNTLEAACKPRYGLGRFTQPLVDVYRFRLVWHGSLLLGALAWLNATREPPSRIFVALCSYYFVQRLLAWWSLRLRRMAG
jgi:hypothetical protein